VLLEELPTLLLWLLAPLPVPRSSATLSIPVLRHPAVPAIMPWVIIGRGNGGRRSRWRRHSRLLLLVMKRRRWWRGRIGVVAVSDGGGGVGGRSPVSIIMVLLFVVLMLVLMVNPSLFDITVNVFNLVRIIRWQSFRN
jgi:hypothetical protein